MSRIVKRLALAGAAGAVALVGVAISTPVRAAPRASRRPQAPTEPPRLVCRRAAAF